MTKNDCLALAQRLHEYVRNPHHVDPISDAFRSLISEAEEAFQIIASSAEIERQSLRDELLEQVKGERDRMIERACELGEQLASHESLFHALDCAWNSHDGREGFGKLMREVEAIAAGTGSES